MSLQRRNFDSHDPLVRGSDRTSVYLFLKLDVPMPGVAKALPMAAHLLGPFSRL